MARGSISGLLAISICGGIELQNLFQYSMSDLVNDVAEKISQNSDLAVSAISMKDQIGYPKRIFDPNEENREGEHSNFDEAYDYASSILDTDKLKVEHEEEFVWFVKE